jgi:Fic family protein
MVLFFVLYEKLDLPILFLSDYITQYKNDYYTFLRNIDQGAESALKDFTIWILLLIEVQSIKTQAIILEIKLLINKTKENFTTDTELNKIYSKELLDFLFIRPFYSITNMEKHLNIHRNTASTYLNLLEKK